MLYNKTKQKKLTSKTQKALTLFQKMLGLMFSKKQHDYSLIFYFTDEEQKKASVHMLFVFYHIDLIYLDSNKKIVDIKYNFKPFSLNYTPKARSKYLIEIPSGTLKENDCSIGDSLEWD